MVAAPPVPLLVQRAATGDLHAAGKHIIELVRRAVLTALVAVGAHV